MCAVNLPPKCLPRKAAVIYWETTMKKANNQTFAEFPDNGYELALKPTN